MLPRTRMLATKNGLPLAALAAAFALAGCTPAGPRALLAGKKSLDQGNYNEAVQELKKATSLLPTNSLAFNYLGLAYHHSGHGQDAEMAYTRAIQLNRSLAEAHFNLGCLLLDENRADKLETAKSELTNFTLRRPEVTEGWLKLGEAQARSRDVVNAERSYNEVLRRSPRQPEALNDLGLLRLQRGRPAEAAAYFKEALKANPTYPPALLNLAIVSQEYLREREFAFEKYREYLALKPLPANAAAVAAVARALEIELHPPPPHAAITPPVLTTNAVPPPQLAKPTPSNPPPQHVAAAAKSEPVRTEAARQEPPRVESKPPAHTNRVASAPSVSQPKPELVAVLPDPEIKPALDVPSSASHPAPPETSEETSEPASLTQKRSKHGLLSSLNPANLFRHERKPAANESVIKTTPPAPTNTATTPTPVILAQTSAPVAPPSPPRLTFARYTYESPAKPAPGNRVEAERSFTLAFEAQNARRFDEAIAQYRAATKADPDYFEAYFNLGVASEASGNGQQALTAYEHALAIRPDSADARYNFALALRDNRYALDAEKELERLLAQHPKEPRAHLALANLYAQVLRQPAKARPHYLKVLEFDPHNPYAAAIGNWLAINPAP